jgi:hypothetical protein
MFPPTKYCPKADPAFAEAIPLRRDARQVGFAEQGNWDLAFGLVELQVSPVLDPRELAP